MHSGFSALRTFLPMDFTARFGPPGRLLATVECDIDRIQRSGPTAAARHGAGPFLFGEFSIADAMFAPVCSRFATYAVPLDPASRLCRAHDGLPAMQEWGRLAAADRGLPAVEEPRPPAGRARRLPPADAAAAPVAQPAAAAPTGPAAHQPAARADRTPEPEAGAPVSSATVPLWPPPLPCDRAAGRAAPGRDRSPRP